MPPQNTVKRTVYLPADVDAALSAWAAEEDRTVPAQLARALRESIPPKHLARRRSGRVPSDA